MSAHNTIHHAGLPPTSSLWLVQSNFQVQSSLSRAVTVDREVGTNLRTLHILNVDGKCETRRRLYYNEFEC